MAFLETLTLIAAVVAGLIMLMVFTASGSAPQEAAGAAMALAIVAIPYCATRILQGRAMLRALDRGARETPPAA
jgi:ABC-type phosphate transport system permease subunit